MGTMTYDHTVVEFDDRTLAHLQIVIIRKFRAHEGLLMSWLDPISIGNGRSSMWLSPDAPLHFKFFGSRTPVVDRAWLELLTQSASSGAGLIVLHEDGTLAHAADQHGLRAAY